MVLVPPLTYCCFEWSPFLFVPAMCIVRCLSVFGSELDTSAARQSHRCSQTGCAAAVAIRVSKEKCVDDYETGLVSASGRDQNTVPAGKRVSLHRLRQRWHARFIIYGSMVRSVPVAAIQAHGRCRCLPRVCSEGRPNCVVVHCAAWTW